ncbi:tail protein X [Sporosarcina sp. FSL K6-5500]|uniref:tail protein X n=1 Tax=Sporosarcina sp. FSL K6-5500 TaxID=2921558 RepID=UPI0030FCE90A
MNYTTIQGDTWDSISYRIYGTGYVMEQLIEANIEHVAIAVFGAGVVIQTPEIDTVQASASVPPWG